MGETIVIEAERFADIEDVFKGQIVFRGDTVIDLIFEKKDFVSPDYRFGKDYLVFPGFIDQHVHLRYGQPEKEDPISGTLAAINGGVTRVMDMPNNPVEIAPLTRETLEAKIEWGKQGYIPIHHYAATKPGSMPIEGVEHYKVFIGKSVGDIWFETEEQLRETLQHYRGKKITFHCELQSEIEKNEGRLYHWQKRPSSAEILAAEIAEKLCRDFGINGNIAHATTMRAINSSKFVEATFHHMLLPQKDSPLFQVNPPLRDCHQRQKLLSAVKEVDGGITAIASDHAPHAPDEKRSANPPSGMPMLDTYGNCAGYLIKQHGFDPKRIAELCSYNPAKWLDTSMGIFVPPGIFAEGCDASFTILNMKKEISMSNHKIYSKADYTPFKKFKMPEVTATFAQGNSLKLEGKVLM